MARTLARAPDAVAARDEIARTLLDLLGATPAPRLAAVRDLTARSTDLARALDRVAIESAADGPAGVGGAASGPPKRGRGRAKGAVAAAVAGSSGPAGASGDGGGDADDNGDEADAADEPGAGKTAVPAAERRRAAGILVGLWRELARDLLVVALGEERQVRDPGLLDDLRTAAATFRSAHPRAVEVAAAGAAEAALGAFLGRLDLAGELLEANVRPELVLDTLLLHWPSATAR
jgi:hypothetical protein